MKSVNFALIAFLLVHLISCEHKKECPSFNTSLLPIDTNQFVEPLKYFDKNDTFELNLIETVRNPDLSFNISTFTKMYCAANFDIILSDTSQKNNISYFFRTYEDSSGVRLFFFIDGSEAYLNLDKINYQEYIKITNFRQHRAEPSERVKFVLLRNLMPLKIVYYNGNERKLIER